MANRVYSLLLNDEVIDEIDNTALSMGTSRSNLINQILAEYVSYTTPEKQMQNVFNALGQMIQDSNIFRLQEHASNSMLSVLSALKYKYHPTIRYCIELSDNPPVVGSLRVVFRTQNESLLTLLQDFFSIFAQLENQYAKTTWRFANGKFERLLTTNQSVSDESLGKAIAQYVRYLDTTIKDYFNAIDQPQQSIAAIKKNMKRYYQTSHCPL